MAIDKTVLLNKQFKGKPTVIVHPGGYSLNESPKLKSGIMKNTIFNSIEKLDVKNVNFLLTKKLYLKIMNTRSSLILNQKTLL